MTRPCTPLLHAVFAQLFAAALLASCDGEAGDGSPSVTGPDGDTTSCSGACLPAGTTLEDLDTRRVNGIVRYADRFPGDTAGQKLAAALADAMGEDCAGGVVDARGFTGEQVIDVPLQVGGDKPYCNPVVLLLGAATFITSEPITVGDRSSIQGNPNGMSPAGGLPTGGTRVSAIRGDTSMPYIVRMTGATPVLQDITIDGGQAEPVPATADLTKTVLFVEAANRIDLTRVSVQHAVGYAIRILNSPVPKLTKVISLRNAGPALSIQTNGMGAVSNDAFVNQCEFESSSIGIELVGASALRVTNSDFGGNKTGVHIRSGSSLNIITGNQFGASRGHDLAIDGGGGNIVTANSVISASELSGALNDTYDVIHIRNSGGNVITGNYIATGTANAKNWSAVHIFSDDDSPLSNAVTGNFIGGTRGSGGAINAAPGTLLTGNLDTTQ
jgi:hypothetical protein